MFEPFRIRNYRFQWTADLVTSWAMEMETLVLGWYILVETGSVLLLTMFGALLFLGTLLSPMLGVVADRIGQRRLICILRAFYVVLSSIVVLVILAGNLTPELVLAIAFLSGLVRPSEQGIRSSLMASLVPAGLLLTATSLSRTTLDSARVGGALVGSGLFAIVGISVTYVVIAALFCLGLVFTLAILTHMGESGDGRSPTVSSPFSLWRELREGLIYIWKTPHLQAAMWIAVLVNFTAFPLPIGLLPYVAREIFGTDQTGLGYLMASFAIGSLVGSIILGTVGHRVRPARAMIFFAIVWHAFFIAFVFVDQLLLGMILLGLAGLAHNLSLVPLVGLLMRTSEPAFRGRVMGVRMLAIYTLPVSLLVAGWLIENAGFRSTMILYMAVGIALTLVIAVRWRESVLRKDAVANAI
ncbi:MAG TPA: arabinose ABC transporter permease [Gammaproteobacteria bacterium]|nr:arabinose ABC transporter permease [Gammaproteobacteria bacterium]